MPPAGVRSTRASADVAAACDSWPVVAVRVSAASAAGEPPATLIVLPVIRSIARSVPCSAASQNDMATPLAPARAVRPMRCT